MGMDLLDGLVMRALIDHHAVAFEGETAAEVLAEAAAWAAEFLHPLEVPTLCLAYGDESFELVLYYTETKEEP